MFGVSGRAMMEALIAGERNPKTMAALARGRMRPKHAELAEALDGRFTDHHAHLLQILTDQLDHLDGAITSVTGRIDELITALPSAAAPPPANDDTGQAC